jgi:hypothetical protein
VPFSTENNLPSGIVLLAKLLLELLKKDLRLETFLYIIIDG